MKRISLATLLLAGLLWAGCTDLVQVNPNEETTGSFWQDQEDAVTGLNAVYNGLQHNGTYGRWLSFAYDLRSDVGYSNSPWTDLSNFVKFTFVSYDFEVNREIWQHHYRGIFRANQAIANTPSIDMDPALRDRLVAEATFLRALFYYNLVNLYGNVPLILEPSNPTDRPPNATPEDVWTQIERDLAAAAEVLPPSYTGGDVGRATSGAAYALLGKAHLQQRDWTAAVQAFEQVFASPAGYELLDDFAANFDANDNDAESIFEVQFGDNSRLSQGIRGQNILKMIGPCGIGFCDGNPSSWYFDAFFAEATDERPYDPRLDATMFWNRPGGMDVYGTPFAERYGADADVRYWKKYGEHWLTLQDWDNPVNYKVMRLGGVLLLYAEALNEAGRTNEAYAPVNRVRARAGMPALPSGLGQEAMRAAIEHEQLMELGLEHERWLYLARHDLLANDRAGLIERDAEFGTVGVTTDRLRYLPIPQTETDLNPSLDQNPGWR